MAGILIIEDDITFAKVLKGFLEKHDHTIEVRHNLNEGTKILKEKNFQLILLDYRLPDGTGVDLVTFLRSQNLKVPVIIMTSFNDVRTAVKAMKLGVYDYITKPIIPEELLMVITEVLHKKVLSPNIPYTEDNQFIEGNSEKSQKLTEYIKLVAPTNISVVIQGESGTGKEQVARSIHRLSKRSECPFVAIDCGALSPELAVSELFGHEKGAFTGAVNNKKGQFEVAHGGTLFLDEIGNLSYEVQVKLLRVLQEKVITPVGSHRIVKVDVRIIAATNDDLLLCVKNGSFREDLYHRLNEFRISVPPLRQRGDDIARFVEHFIALSNAELGKAVRNVSNEVMQIFFKYEWPGNLRELKNTIKRAVLLSKGNIIEKEMLPEEMIVEAHSNPYYSEFNLKTIQESNEREMIIKTLQETKNNKAQAARLLNIDRKTLYQKLAKYNIGE